MAYATVAEVQARIPTQLLEIGTASQPTTAQVTAWLTAESLWIDAALRWRYSVPVTDADDLLRLATICAALVASRCWTVLGGHSAEVVANAEQLRNEALSMLAYDRRTGRALLVLPGTSLSGSGEAAVMLPESSFTDPDGDDSVDYLFKAGEDAW